MMLIVYMGILLLVIIFICFLTDGEFSRNKKDDTYERWEMYQRQIELGKQRRMAEYLKNRMSNEKLRELQYQQDLANIEICVLEAENEILDTVSSAGRRTRVR